ncbi:MAG: 16S rRNA (adenine(1518)-N(6)/adenine(1519)-N(6))-dimethyltransferase RsmA [Paludibacteraceae bacterium]|nr:16S rRNA (adenine(1518)-N(6)/adenine(1519)-N(6))-dimethyltransferase RsmA [Paludibacteraceae bacterium]
MVTQVRAKKHLGQHFLKDLTIARRIAESLELDIPTDVLEIGPGMGVLTQFLLKDANIRLTAVEIDHESVAYLHEYYPELHLVEGDFLRMRLEDLYADRFCVIGNFPYNISSQIFFKVLDYKDRIPCVVGMLQKEVAERLAEPPGSKTYGILSVLLQAYYDIEYLFTVDETVFAPPPKVKSAVIRMRRNTRTSLGCDERLFVQVVKTAFNQRRKQLRNSLRPLIGKNDLTEANEESKILDDRPERLSVEDFVRLTNMVAKHLVNGDR